MHLKTPAFWYRDKSAIAAVLAPVAALYGRIAEARSKGTAPYRFKIPVICIGNFTAGGGGKTPTAIAVAEVLKAMGERPVFLTRGYGGKMRGPAFVEKMHGAEDVGDEPLLLAEHAPTMVAADRAAGARAIEATEATIIVMDDGFQHPGLAKDLSLIVVEGASGVGNGRVLPAGPLRAPLESQLPRADALLVIGGGGKAAALADSFARDGKPVLKAKIAADCDPRWLGVLPAVAFAGIARPAKFFATLRGNGARLIDAHAFPDHHRFSARQARRLLAQAQAYNAMLVTTAKDWVRLPDDDSTPQGELKHRSRPFPIAVKFEDAAALVALLTKALRKS